MNVTPSEIPTSQTLPTSALDWVNGHILGNGDIGAVVWGTPEHLAFGLSKHNVWDLSHPRPHGNRWDTHYTEMRQRILDGKRDLLQTVGMTGYAHSWQEFQVSCGALHLNLLENQQWVDHKQSLSYSEGVCTVEIPMSECGYMWGADYKGVRVTSFVHAIENAVILRIESDASYTCSWSYTRSPSDKLTAPEFEIVPGRVSVAVMSHALTPDNAYAVAITSDAKNFSTHATPLGILGQLTFGGAAGPATIILSMGSSFDKGITDFKQKAITDCLSALAQNAEVLRASHRQWWTAFWEKSAVRHPDPEITRLWYRGLYALASSTRPYLSAPHLQGIWNQHVLPAWHTDFHNNLNVQESHWAAISSNHPECQEALIRCLIHDWREEFRLLAREQFDSPGLAIGLCHDWLGRSLGGWVFDVELAITAWYGLHIWGQFEADRDLLKLREEYLPWLREACEFYCHILHEDAAGQFNFVLSHSPEQFHHDAAGNKIIALGKNPTIDIVFTNILFRHFVKGCVLLGIDDEFVKRCAHIRDHLPPVPTLDGVLIDQELIYLPSGDIPGKFPHSDRTPARLTGIFPGDQINLNGPSETVELGRRSFAEFLSYGDSDFSGWSYSWQACLAARLGLAEEAHRCLRILLKDFTLAGGLTSHNKVRPGHDPIFQIEALLGAPQAINEMMLQAVNGTIRLFPAILPGQACSFRNLRAGGSLLVSASHDGFKVTDFSIEALHDTPILLHQPWQYSDRVSVTDALGKSFHLTGSLLEWSARSGEKFDVRLS